MSRSAIYVANTNSNTVSVGGTIPMGTPVHGFGCSCRMNGNTIAVGSGYYNVDVSVTAAASAVGTVSVQLMQDGVAVPGAIGTVTASAIADVVTISFPALIRVAKCSASFLSLVLTGQQATVSNVAVEVESV